MLAEFGAPEIVVSNAGAFLVAPLERTTLAELETQLAANLKAPFLVARAFLPPMRQAGRGHHIAIGSIADHEVFPENTAYTASKFALRGLHEVLRKEYRGSGLRFTLVSPGPTDTRIWDPIGPDERPGFLPRRDMLQVGDVAEVVAFVVTRPPRVAIDWIRVNPA